MGLTRLRSHLSYPHFRYTNITIQYHEGLWNFDSIHRCNGRLITFAPAHRFLPTSNIHEEIQPDGRLVYCIVCCIPAFVLNRSTKYVFFIPENQDLCQGLKYITTHGLPLIQVMILEATIQPCSSETTTVPQKTL